MNATSVADGSRTARMGGGFAPRFVLFCALCLAWLVAMRVWRDCAWLQDMGTTWFINWTIQASVAAASWWLPFEIVAPVCAHRQRSWSPRLSRMLGLRVFGRIVRRLNPLPFDGRDAIELERAMTAAETTHTVTCVVVGALSLTFALRGAALGAFALTIWNVFFNLYPILLQRQNRARLREVARRRQRRGR